MALRIRNNRVKTIKRKIKNKTKKIKKKYDKKCVAMLLHLLDEYKVNNLNSLCRHNENFICEPIHMAIDEFIEDLRMWIINEEWDAGDCRK